VSCLPATRGSYARRTCRTIPIIDGVLPAKSGCRSESAFWLPEAVRITSHNMALHLSFGDTIVMEGKFLLLTGVWI
jgi:hypothetical protein